MKKTIIKSAFVAACIAVAGYAVYHSQNEVKLSELAMENVEALAGGESVTVECPGGRTECARVIMGNTVHLYYKR